MAPLLQIVIASTRPGRAGGPVAHWVQSLAQEDGRFSVELVDLADPALPLMDEAKHPRLRDYAHEHTRRWSATVERADAFVFVHPEYNHSFNAPLKNAIDYLHVELAHKPVGLVSYGGVAGGTRAVAMLKPVLAVLKMLPLSEGVIIPFVGAKIEDGSFTPSEENVGAARAMLDELARVEPAMRSLRSS